MKTRTFVWFVLVMAMLLLGLFAARGGSEGRLGRWLSAIHGR